MENRLAHSHATGLLTAPSPPTLAGSPHPPLSQAPSRGSDDASLEDVRRDPAPRGGLGDRRCCRQDRSTLPAHYWIVPGSWAPLHPRLLPESSLLCPPPPLAPSEPSLGSMGREEERLYLVSGLLSGLDTKD